MRIGTIKFWGQVNKNGPNHPTLGPCWVWTGGTCNYGYGVLRVGSTSTRAHRYSYRLEHGPIPGKLCVLHKCDNPPCVRPSHLFLGTRVDNNRDRTRKNREVPCPGILNGRVKLSEDQVQTIRVRYTRGSREWGLRGIARKYKISPTAVRFILIRKNWRHLGP